MLSYSLYIEIKHRKYSLCVEYMAAKAPVVTEILTKQHRGSFYGTPVYSLLQTAKISKWPKYDFCISQGSVETVLSRGVKNYSKRRVSS